MTITLDPAGGNVTTSTTPSPYDERATWLVLFQDSVIGLRVLLSLIGFPANALVLYVVYKFSDMRNYSNMFCASLAIADNLLIMHDLTVTLPATLKLYAVLNNDSFEACFVTQSANILNLGCGFHLLVIAIDRHIFINSPFKYARIMSWLKYPMLITCWIPGNVIGYFLYADFGCGPPQEFANPVFGVTSIAIFFTLTLIVTALYVSILLTAYKQRRAIERTLPTLHAQNSDLDKLKAEVKALIGFILIGASSFFNWIAPSFYLLALIRMYRSPGYPSQGLRTTIYLAQSFLGLIVSINNVMNPFVYSFTQVPFKRHFREIFHGLCARLNSEEQGGGGGGGPFAHRPRNLTITEIDLDVKDDRRRQSRKSSRMTSSDDPVSKKVSLDVDGGGGGGGVSRAAAAAGRIYKKASNQSNSRSPSVATRTPKPADAAANNDNQSTL